MSCYKAATDTIDALRERNEELKQQRDELLAAAEQAVDALGKELNGKAHNILFAAIAKVKP